MTAVHHHVAIASESLGEHTITIEPITATLRAAANITATNHSAAVVYRINGDLINVCDTNVSDQHARSRATVFATGHLASLTLTALQITRGDVLIDHTGARHTVTSVYPVDQVSITVHTSTGHHEHLTWSEAHTSHYTVDTAGGKR